MELKKCTFRVLKNGEPTFIGRTGNYNFYECPKHGDESPLLININGDWFETDFWEVPSLVELEE